MNAETSLAVVSYVNAWNAPWWRALLCGVIGILLPIGSVLSHTPYGQWDSFRARHLQVLTSRSDLAGDALAEKWVGVLVEHLPNSKAVVSRARNVVRIASLLKTDQAKLAVLSPTQALALLKGTEPFDNVGATPLQVLLDSGSHLLVARTDLPKKHGFLLVATLLDDAAGLQLTVPVDNAYGLGVHPGALEALARH